MGRSAAYAPSTRIQRITRQGRTHVEIKEIRHIAYRRVRGKILHNIDPRTLVLTTNSKVVRFRRRDFGDFAKKCEKRALTCNVLWNSLSKRGSGDLCWSAVLRLHIDSKK